jgi:hypothetical protein
MFKRCFECAVVDVVKVVDPKRVCVCVCVCVCEVSSNCNAFSNSKYSRSILQICWRFPVAMVDIRVLPLNSFT